MTYIQSPEQESQLPEVQEKVDINADIRFSPEVMKNNLLHLLSQNAAAIAHEVRNPLQTLMALLDNAESTGTFDEKYVSLVREEVARADMLLTDFLGLFKSNQHNFTTHNLNDICTKMAMLMRASAMLHGIEIEEDYALDLPICVCDESKIKQLLINLLSNAFDASHRGQKVVISTNMDQLYCCLAVKDYGCGISDEILESIFQPFFTKKASGTGLGLFLCKQIAEEHGGFLRCESQYGKGSCFTLCLPL
jgi:signal transduction histidine kinase